MSESTHQPARELTPQQRSLRARMAAHARWAKESPDHHLPKARAAFMARFEREVDPDGVLPEAERNRRAEHARRAYFVALSYKSSRARAKRGKAAARSQTTSTDAPGDDDGGTAHASVAK